MEFAKAFFDEIRKLADTRDHRTWPASVATIKGTEQTEPNELPPPKRRDLKRYLKLKKKDSSSYVE